MARVEHVLTVFVASPGDVADERSRLEEVISELNVTWSRELGLRLELIRWETHAYPSFGVDAQDVINKQIPNDCDIFIGLMWSRFGTPTGRAESGTEEEFRRAKARYDEDANSVSIMVYFKDQPISPSQMDLDQLQKISAFQKSLGEEGSLYWRFTDVGHFEKLVRLHLSRQVQAMKVQHGLDRNAPVLPEPSSDAVSSQESSIDNVEDDDLGFFDYVDIFERNFEILTDIIDNLGAASYELAGKTTVHSEEMTALPRDAKGIVNRKDAKRVIANAASDMNAYTARLNAEIPLFKQTMESGFNALVRAVEISIDFGASEAEKVQARQSLQQIDLLREQFADSVESTAAFRQSVATLPRMSTDLNRAKRGVVNILDDLIYELEDAQTLLLESAKAIRDLLGDGSDTVSVETTKERR